MMMFEHLVLFDCWSKNNRRAEELANWLEDVILRTQWILNSFGACRVFFWGREEEEEVYRFRSDITKRTVGLYVQTQRHTLARATRIRTIDTTFTATTSIEEELVEPNVILSWPGAEETAGDVSAEIVE
jgi:hypothetical protein